MVSEGQEGARAWVDLPAGETGGSIVFRWVGEPRKRIGGTKVFFRKDEVHGFDREYEEGAGEDLSVGGMFVSTKVPMPVGMVLRLKILIPHEIPREPPVTVRALVRWQGPLKGGPRGLGVQFLEFKGIGELRLKVWLDTILAADPEAAAAAGLASRPTPTPAGLAVAPST
jgi:hypothetical protein